MFSLLLVTADSKSFPLSCVPETELDSKLDQRIKQLLCICFPDGYAVFSKTRFWHGSVPSYSLLFEQDGKVLGHVGVTIRQIQAGSVRIKIAGIQGVAVAPELRGSGLAQQLMNDSMKEA